MNQPLLQRCLGITIIVGCLAGGMYLALQSAHAPTHRDKHAEILHLTQNPAHPPLKDPELTPIQTFVLSEEAPVEHVKVLPGRKDTHTPEPQLILKSQKTPAVEHLTQTSAHTTSQPAWVLRAGIFSHTSNAQNLTHSLHALPWRVTRREMQWQHKNHDAVYIGPFKSRQEAHIVQQTLKKRYHLNTILIQEQA